MVFFISFNCEKCSAMSVAAPFLLLDDESNPTLLGQVLIKYCNRCVSTGYRQPGDDGSQGRSYLCTASPGPTESQRGMHWWCPCVLRRESPHQITLPSAQDQSASGRVPCD